MQTRAKTSRWQRNRPSTSDPTDPRNHNRTLEQMARQDGEMDRDFDASFARSVRELEEIEQRPAPFWDAQSLIAVGLSLVVGGVIGIPIGQYLYHLAH